MAEFEVTLDHVSLATPPALLADVRLFYGSLLRLPEKPRPAGLADWVQGAWFHLQGGLELHIVAQLRPDVAPAAPSRRLRKLQSLLDVAGVDSSDSDAEAARASVGGAAAEPRAPALGLGAALEPSLSSVTMGGSLAGMVPPSPAVHVTGGNREAMRQAASRRHFCLRVRAAGGLSTSSAGDVPHANATRSGLMQAYLAELSRRAQALGKPLWAQPLGTLEPDLSGRERTFLIDPAGNRIELLVI